ncbi:MAG: FecR domain-containing protein [Clostridium sp.]
MKKMGSKLLIGVFMLLFLSIGINTMADEITAESRKLLVLSVKGSDATVTKGGSKELKATEGMPLGQGSKVKTGKKTNVYLEADDDKIIKMDTNSLVEITKATAKKLKITLKTGALFFNVEHPLKDDEELTFDAAQTSMSIRGTSGIFQFTENGIEIFLVEGSVEFQIGNQTITLKPGQRIKLKKVSEDGEILNQTGMGSGYEIEEVGTFNWEDLDAFGLAAILEQRDKLNLDFLGLDSAGKIAEAEKRLEELQELQAEQAAQGATQEEDKRTSLEQIERLDGKPDDENRTDSSNNQTNESSTTPTETPTEAPTDAPTDAPPDVLPEPPATM